MLNYKKLLGNSLVLALASSIAGLSALASDTAPALAVPHTPPRNQHAVGFCWSYTLSGLIESEALKQHMSVQLSPEYLGFYHLYNQLHKHIPWFRQQARHLSEDSTDNAFNRIYVRNRFFAPDEGNDESLALEEVKSAGTVPLTAFNHPIGDAQEDAMTKRIKSFIKEKMFDEGTLDQYTPVGEDGLNDALFKDFAKAFGFTPPKPNEKFTYRGQSYTPIEFLNEYLKFDPDQFVQITASKESQPRDLELIRTVMQQGYAVPVGIPIFEDKDSRGVAEQVNAEKSGVFTVNDCGGRCKDEEGGHEVLGVNWTENSSHQVTGIVIKNSWGLIGVNDRGQQDVSSRRGFFTVEASYLMNAFDPQVKDSWDFVVPRQFAGSRR